MERNKWVWGLIGAGIGASAMWWFLKRRNQAQLALPAGAGQPQLLPPDTGYEAAGAVGAPPIELPEYNRLPGGNRLVTEQPGAPLPPEPEATSSEFDGGEDEFNNNGEF